MTTTQELENQAPATWYVNVLAVLPQFRNLGLGTELPIGLPADRDDQPDPSLSHRAGHRRQGRPARPSQLALRNIREPKGRDITTNGRSDPRSVRRLVPARRAH